MSCKIYCIEDCNGLKYVGSTIHNLNERLSRHKYDKKMAMNTSSKKLDLDNCKIYELESCEISHRKEREKYWINITDCVNTIKLNFDKKEYDEKHKDKRKEYNKKRYLENREKILQQTNEYHKKNKDKRKEYYKE